ncbi:hypothetical protein K439DRAFT_308282 [Ramaria rubella]|nr:hypothetical protein K439DRAFT_308282 [Ramaria rubella]
MSHLPDPKLLSLSDLTSRSADELLAIETLVSCLRIPTVFQTSIASKLGESEIPRTVMKSPLRIPERAGAVQNKYTRTLEYSSASVSKSRDETSLTVPRHYYSFSASISALCGLLNDSGSFHTANRPTVSRSVDFVMPGVPCHDRGSSRSVSQSVDSSREATTSSSRPVQKRKISDCE